MTKSSLEGHQNRQNVLFVHCKLSAPLSTHSIECFSIESFLYFFQVAFQGGNTFVLWKLFFFPRLSRRGICRKGRDSQNLKKSKAWTFPCFSAVQLPSCAAPTLTRKVRSKNRNKLRFSSLCLGVFACHSTK